VLQQSAFLAGCGGSIFKKGLKFMVHPQPTLSLSIPTAYPRSAVRSGSAAPIQGLIAELTAVRGQVDMKLLTATFGGGLQQIFLNCGPVLAMAAFVIWAEHRLHHTK
jgi:hypothetical protein